MLTLETQQYEALNEITNEFVYIDKCELHLEHSLIAISKWESKHHKIFLDGERKTDAEIRDYAQCMCIDKNVNPLVWKLLTPKDFIKILNYIDDPMTGTTFAKDDDADNGHPEKLSSELIYYYMTAHKVPFSCERWHLNRLLTLLKICGIKNNVDTKPKSSQSQLLNKYASIHAAKKRAKKK